MIALNFQRKLLVVLHTISNSFLGETTFEDEETNDLAMLRVFLTYVKLYS